MIQWIYQDYNAKYHADYYLQVNSEQINSCTQISIVYH